MLPILSKVFERHLFNALHNFLLSNNLLYNLQSGFRGHHSTETALITIIDRALNNLDNNCINGFIFADFKKAFDFVDHDVLLEWLRLYDLDDSSLHLMRSYLTSRKQFTTVKKRIISTPRANTRCTTRIRTCPPSVPDIHQRFTRSFYSIYYCGHFC